MTFGILTLIVACGLAGPLLSRASRLAVPVVVGEIAAGVLIGRTGLRAIDTGDPTVVFLSDAGFAMLMFVVGTHLPLRDPGLRRALRSATIATALSFAVAVPAGWGLAHATAIKHPALFVLLLAASSSAVVMPILHERGLAGGGVLLATAWVALVDIATIVALPVALAPSRSSRSSTRPAETGLCAPCVRTPASAAGRSICGSRCSCCSASRRSPPRSTRAY
jgi:Kef-type K+ transport system membrane component KefB